MGKEAWKDEGEVINKSLGENVKRLRNLRQITLDQFSEITGVSKSILSQIEKGTANPTLSTIWKIANGMRVSFSSLISNTHSEARVISKEDVTPLVTADGLCEVIPFFTFNPERNFEILFVTYKPSGFYEGTKHQPGTQEFIVVFSGELVIKHGDSTDLVKAGQAFSFFADVEHTYYNVGKNDTVFIIVQQYKNLLE